MKRRWFVWGALFSVGLVAAALWFLRVEALDVPPRVELPSINAQLLVLSAEEITRRGPPRIMVVRFDGPGEFVPFHFEDRGLTQPQTAEAWAESLGAAVVFNAGQFDESYRHLGWLKAEGRWLSRLERPQWKALLASGPTKDGVWARVVDLEHAQKEVADERYDHLLQSMMLVDDQRTVRVRDTDISANRTVVAEDREGRILVVVTEGATTLGDLARWLPEQGLDIVRAMNLDGGIESQLVINTPEYQQVFSGQYGTGTTVFDAPSGKVLRYPLPAVVAFFPKRAQPL